MSGSDDVVDYHIVLIEASGRPMPPSEDLPSVGVPIAIAARYDALRKHFGPAGLERWARAHRN